MLGSTRKCSNCNSTSFLRVKVNRTIQCENCKFVLEERCISDLMEYHAITQTEEVHCVITPDHLHRDIVDDIPNDPYCTPGFISGFRMLSPLCEPIYAASARTFSGSLAEMERVIGDALFAGYVGYNGRAPGSAAKKEEASDPGERNKSGGDARHTLVAYFEIVELASILCVDRETANLAIRTFRHTANNTSLRNRNVESLATAAFVSAAERRWHEYQEWLKQKNGSLGSDGTGASKRAGNESGAQTSSEWPTPPRQLTVEEISTAANLDVSDVLRYLKVVNVALRKQRPENSSSVTTHMPTFCRRLELPTTTSKLAIGLAENAMQNNICSRRNPISISAAAIYLACQMEGIRKTQTEICRATTLTEVTLRKVYKELNRERSSLIPEWYQHEEKGQASRPDGKGKFSRYLSRPSSQEEPKPGGDVSQGAAPVGGGHPSTEQKGMEVPLEPPPLPPGFGGNLPGNKRNVSVPSAPPAPHVPPGAVSNPSPLLNTSNPMLAMFNNPAMQAFANVFSMVPQLMPPPPPPLPPVSSASRSPSAANGAGTADKGASAKAQGAAASASGTREMEGTKENKEQEGETHQRSSTALVPNLPGFPQPPPLPSIPPLPTQLAPAGSNEFMAHMQSMVGMVQAMQAIQAMQQHASPVQASDQSPDQMKQVAMMAMAMAQAQTMDNSARGSTPQLPPVEPNAAANPSAPAAPARDRATEEEIKTPAEEESKRDGAEDKDQ